MSTDQLDRDTDTDEIVAAVKDELADERFLGDKVLVSRRELVGLAAGSATVAGLLGHETGTASAQSSGTGRLGDPTPLEYVGTDSLVTESVNGMQWCGNNTSELPDVKSALQNAANGDVIGIAPGQHDTPGDIDITSDITIFWLGGLNLTDSTASYVVNCEEQVHIIANGNVQGSQPGITSSVSDSAIGLWVHMQSSTAGPFHVNGVGSHGVFFEQRTGDNTNGSDMVLVSNNNGGDGIRIENTSGNSPNLNAMYLRFPTIFGNDGYGLNVINGFDNAFEVVNTESNGQAGVRHAATNRNHYRITHAEGNETSLASSNDVILDADFAIVEGIGALNYTINTGSNHLLKQFGNMTSGRVKSGSTDVLDREVMIDSTNGRLVFADDSGNRWYVSGTTF